MTKLQLQRLARERAAKIRAARLENTETKEFNTPQRWQRHGYRTRKAR